MSSDLNSPTPPPAEEEEPQDMGAEEEEETEEEPEEPGSNSLGMEPLLLAPYGTGDDPEDEDDEYQFETREDSDEVLAIMEERGLS